jgi:putative PIN family toxin of toxin-antitoxin system
VIVVIDTNVLVSAALRDRDPQAAIEWVLAQPDWDWVVSPAILAEYEQVLARPRFGLTADLRARWRALLAQSTVAIDPPACDFPRDQDDAPFLACAIAARADYLVTGDRDFAEARKLLTTTILSVSMFKRLVCDTAQ